MKFRMTLLCVVAAACVPAVAGAQQPSAVELTLEAALEQARERAPAVRQAAGEVDVARAEVTSASVFSPYNPTVSVGAGPRFGGEAGDEVTPNVDVSVGQQFELGGKRRARIAVAEASVDEASWRRRDVARQQQLEAASAYLEALHAQERLEVAQAIVDLSDEFLDAATRREQAGDVGQMEVNLARLTFERSKSAFSTWRARQSARRGTLVATLGLEPGVELQLTSDLVPDEALELSALEDALDERPDLAALRAQGKRASAEQTLADAQEWPDIGVSARYGREEGANIFMGGLSVTLPLFAHGQGLAQAAEARANLAEQRLQDVRRQARARLLAAFERYEELVEARRHYQREVLPIVTRNEEMTRQAYEAGALGLADVLAVRRELIEARQAYVDLALECALARVEAQFIAGAIQ